MFPDESYASPRGSFNRPVIAPNVDPDASPTKSIAINCQWLPFIRGSLQQLLLQATWDPLGPPLALTQGRVWNLIDLFQECTSGIPFACPYSFSEGDEGWGIFSNASFTPMMFGYYVAGEGFSCGDEVGNSDASVWGYGYFGKLLPAPVTAMSIQATFDLEKGAFVTDVTGGLYACKSGSTVASATFNCRTRPDGHGQTIELDLSSVSIDEIQFLLVSHVYNAGGGPPGSGMLRNVILQGVGLADCG